MNKNFFANCFVVVFLSLVWGGCVNLKHVNDFATASLKGVQGFETMPLSFQILCLDNCREQDIKSGKLNASKCDCNSAHLADSTDYLFYNTVTAYLDGLEKLSADKTTNYKFDGLNDQFAGLGVSTADAGAYAKLGSILTKAVTDGYRRNKIKEYIKDANTPLQIVIQHLKTNISTSLVIEMNVNKSKLESDYLDLVKNSRGNAFEQRKIIEEFYKLKTTMESQLAALKAYGNLLKAIAEGHEKLAENLDKLDKAGLKDSITQYASNIKDIRTQIQILNKK